jgi:hypothetical protein
MRRLFLLVIVVAAAAVVFLSIALTRLHQAPWDKTPSQFHACGRTYVLPAHQSVARSIVEGQGLSVQQHVWTWQGRRAVWGTKLGTSCGTNAYLQIGGNEFRSYNLSGTP